MGYREDPVNPQSHIRMQHPWAGAGGNLEVCLS